VPLEPADTGLGKPLLVGKMNVRLPLSAFSGSPLKVIVSVVLLVVTSMFGLTVSVGSRMARAGAAGSSVMPMSAISRAALSRQAADR